VGQKYAGVDIDGPRPGVTEPAQRLQMPVAELDRMERSRQRGAIDLRVVARSGYGANVHDLLHPVRAEQFQELSGVRVEWPTV
jgi:hypothetical protein